MRLLILCLLISFEVLSFYPDYQENSDLSSQIQEQDFRKLKNVSDWYSAAIDGRVYRNALGSKDFYHGNGYLLSFRGEVKSDDYYTLNLKSLFISGSSSNGYSEPSTDNHFLAFSTSYLSRYVPGKLDLRVGDLNRKTLGVGLMLKDKETNGTSLTWTVKDFTFTRTEFGTSGLKAPGDLDSNELFYKDRLIGVSFLTWSDEDDSDDYKEGNLEDYAYEQEYIFKEDMTKPLVSLFSKVNLAGSTQLYTELGSRNEVFGGLIGLSSSHTSKSFIIDWNLFYRRYDRGFAAGFSNDIDHEYVSYDQLDKNFNLPINIFSYGDGVGASSLILNFEYLYSSTYTLYSLNDFTYLAFDFKLEPELYYGTNYPRKYDKNFQRYFYKFGLAIYPSEKRTDYFTGFISNKALGLSSLYKKSIYNLPLNIEYTYFGVEAVFSL